MIQVTPVIHYGDSGTRLRPLSLTGGHKQLFSFMINESESLFQKAVQRLVALGAEAPQGFQLGILHGATQTWDNLSTAANLARPFVSLGKAQFAAGLSEHIDYTIMERRPGRDSSFSISMVPLVAGWNGLDAWGAVRTGLSKDAQGNAHLCDVLISDSRNTLIRASSRLLGVKNFNAIETSDPVLLVDNTRSQDVKHILNKLPATRPEVRPLRRKVHRPWGWHHRIVKGGHFKVKRMQVKPGACLNPQQYQLRADHRLVVKGVVENTNGRKLLLLTENQSTYGPLGIVRGLANPGAILLEITEVQSGSYLGEDEIGRIENRYGRTTP